MISMFTFYREKHFKETPIGKIPEDWKIEKLENLAVDIYYGITAKAVERKTNLKMLRTTDIKDYSVDWDNLPFCEITEKRSKLSKYFLKKGDLIVARAGTAGVSVLVEGDFDKVIFGSYLIKIRLKNEVLPKYIHYFFQSDIYWNHIISNQAGSTLKNINLPILRSLKIPIPSSLQEQKAIVHILSTIDETIQKTNEIIEKIKRLKKGLMQELLTKGIGHKEFKNTEIGRIPKEWDTYGVSTIFEPYKGTTPSTRIAEYWNGNIPFVTPTDITKLSNLNMIYLERTENYLTQKGLKSKGLKLVPKNSLLLTSRATIGYLAINKVPVTINQGIISLRPKRKDVNIVFFYYLLQKLKKYLENLSGGSTYREISISTLMKVKLPFPPFSEQEKIAETLLTVDKRLRVERKRKEKLERIKKALMDLLLTGKIRIRVN